MVMARRVMRKANIIIFIIILLSGLAFAATREAEEIS